MILSIFICHGKDVVHLPSAPETFSGSIYGSGSHEIHQLTKCLISSPFTFYSTARIPLPAHPPCRSTAGSN